MILTSILAGILKKTYLSLSVIGQSDAVTRPSRQLRLTLKHIDSVNAFLAMVSIATFALFAISISFLLGVIPAFLLIFSFFILIFVFLPKTRVGDSTLLANLMARPLAYVLSKLENQIRKSDRYIERLGNKFHKTKPIGKDGLVKFLKEQQSITEGDAAVDLALALSSLSLNSQKISYLMIRKKKAHLVGADEPVGPVLLSELHETGRMIFPAVDKQKNFVGTIGLARLSELKSGGKAGKAVNSQVVKVEKNKLLIDALQSFAATGAGLLFVEDETGEIEGVIYLEDVLNVLLPEAETEA